MVEDLVVVVEVVEVALEGVDEEVRGWEDVEETTILDPMGHRGNTDQDDTRLGVRTGRRRNQ